MNNLWDLIDKWEDHNNGSCPYDRGQLDCSKDLRQYILEEGSKREEYKDDREAQRIEAEKHKYTPDGENNL